MQTLRTFWRFLALAMAMLGARSQLRGADDFRVLDIYQPSPGSVRVVFLGDTNSYFLLLRSGDVATNGQPVAGQSGHGRVGAPDGCLRDSGTGLLPGDAHSAKPTAGLGR